MQQSSPSTSDSGFGVTKASPPSWPVPDEDVLAALTAAYRDGSWGRYDGPHGRRLVERLQAMHRGAEVLLCSSGTIAVELALRGLKVGPGDEVILAGYDFPGNFRAIEVVGARPVLVDLADRSWTIDADVVQQARSPQTRAIIVSHLHGTLADMPRLMEICRAASVAVVEDACQTPGALIAGSVAGSWGDVGIHSFGGSKLLTAGRGGAIVTPHAEVAQRVRVYSQRGNEAFPLSELQAAVLLPQLDKLAERNERRRQSARILEERLAGHPEIEVFPETRSGYVPAYYKFGLFYRPAHGGDDLAKVSGARQRWIGLARSAGIAIDEGFRGFARRSAGRCRVAGNLARAERAARDTVILHHPVLLQEPEAIKRVAEALVQCAQAASK
jgi:dTDP-4-amino-4,6-dideoxygalactose transaminase